MYPMSKSKASFRIADILHQQQQQQHQTDSHLLAQHLMMKNGHQFHSNDFKNDLKTRSDASSSGKQSHDLSNSPSPDTSSSLPPVEASTSSPNHHSASNERGSGGGGKSDFPMKPTPMYSNFQLPFPLGIHPAFHPAAYLNYADAIHKGKQTRVEFKRRKKGRICAHTHVLWSPDTRERKGVNRKYKFCRPEKWQIHIFTHVTN